MRPETKPLKLRAAERIIKGDRREGRDILLWALHLYTPKQIYTALLAQGWVWSVTEGKWLNSSQMDNED